MEFARKRNTHLSQKQPPVLVGDIDRLRTVESDEIILCGDLVYGSMASDDDLDNKMMRLADRKVSFNPLSKDKTTLKVWVHKGVESYLEEYPGKKLYVAYDTVLNWLVRRKKKTVLITGWHGEQTNLEIIVFDKTLREVMEKEIAPAESPSYQYALREVMRQLDKDYPSAIYQYVWLPPLDEPENKLQVTYSIDVLSEASPFNRPVKRLLKFNESNNACSQLYIGSAAALLVGIVSYAGLVIPSASELNDLKNQFELSEQRFHELTGGKPINLDQLQAQEYFLNDRQQKPETVDQLMLLLQAAANIGVVVDGVTVFESTPQDRAPFVDHDVEFTVTIGLPSQDQLSATEQVEPVTQRLSAITGSHLRVLPAGSERPLYVAGGMVKHRFYTIDGYFIKGEGI